VREKSEGVGPIFFSLRFTLRFLLKMPKDAFPANLGVREFSFFLLGGMRAKKKVGNR